MSQHSHVKVWVHLIWGTYDNERVLNKQLRVHLFDHLVSLSKQSGVVIEKLNIQPEHIHILIPMLADKTIAQTAKAFKGESSRWINENDYIESKFRWQRGYGAFSVSASLLKNVKNYIENQDEHHRRKSFSEEYKEWTIKYGIHVE